MNIKLIKAAYLYLVCFMCAVTLLFRGADSVSDAIRIMRFENAYVTSYNLTRPEFMIEQKKDNLYKKTKDNSNEKTKNKASILSPKQIEELRQEKILADKKAEKKKKTKKLTADLLWSLYIMLIFGIHLVIAKKATD